MFKKSIALAVSLALFSTSMFAGIDASKAAYSGGTVDLKQGKEAKFSLIGDKFTFQADKKTSLSIPYDRIQSIEYGQKAGQRIGAAIGWTIVAGPIGLLALLLYCAIQSSSFTGRAKPTGSGLRGPVRDLESHKHKINQFA